jgi:hypothetical protein
MHTNANGLKLDTRSSCSNISEVVQVQRHRTSVRGSSTFGFILV